ncbi:hypothetical protein F8388_015109 [Cannabis sativa]|uniref:Uncharacterized protein n=1 Tax=Cannabis sativa TaxID=3483 RepID=A0A7J6ER56_CANSA|nr:hypothetical protein F8388_015109 [Cannabis sativa]
MSPNLMWKKSKSDEPIQQQDHEPRMWGPKIELFSRWAKDPIEKTRPLLRSLQHFTIVPLILGLLPKILLGLIVKGPKKKKLNLGVEVETPCVKY